MWVPTICHPQETCSFIEILGHCEIFFETHYRNQGIKDSDCNNWIKKRIFIDSFTEFEILWYIYIHNFYFYFFTKKTYNYHGSWAMNNEQVQGLGYWKKHTEIKNLSLVRNSFCLLNTETECFNLQQLASSSAKTRNPWSSKEFLKFCPG